MKAMKILNPNFFIILLTCLTFSFTSFAQDEGLSIIGHSGSVPDELNMKQLKSVLLGEKLRWDDGVSIKLALMKTTTPIGSTTCQKIYGMSGNELNKHFLSLVFQGKVKAPTFFNSVSELESYVAQTPGAIGVSQNPSASSIKTVLIDGNKQIQ